MDDRSYFTQEMFEYLSKYGNQPNNRHNDPDQQHAYEVLVEAYKITEKWAREIQETFCPDGYTKLRKSPVSQGNHFFEYNWAKIYPKKGKSPAELALIVGIGAEDATVKIDTVNAKPDLREKYEQFLKNNESHSIIHSVSKEKVLSFTYDELVKWSSEFVPDLLKQYDNLVEYLGLDEHNNGHENQESQQASAKVKNGLPNQLNQILYGPPGTGKTYHTIDAAVRMAEPDFYVQLVQITDEKEFRLALKRKYDELVKQERIRFVTFHQSYGYEEFVEGLSAKTEKGKISYYEKVGVFKSICHDAAGSKPPLLKIGDKFNSIEVLEISPELYTFKKQNGNKLPISRELIDQVYEFFKEGRFSIDDEKKNWLSRFSNDIETYFVTGYDRLYKAMLPKMLERSLNNETSDEVENYVLIIDEINRGNISKIFGELITLIEPSKRDGKSESLQLTLPYSGESFSVPSNLYLIGTMNTADRSLATMDTALRRRFDFIEMMPQPELLESTSVNGIDLTQLLDTMNQRIEVLYDREHTLGHAFFIPVKERADNPDKAFSKLVSIFKNKIIPLLQEYFFEDWQKIRLVLGDNQKAENLQFVEERTLDNKELNTLFGEQHNLNVYGEELKQYTLKEFGANTVWFNPDSYIGIYDSSTPSQSEEIETLSDTETNSNP